MLLRAARRAAQSCNSLAQPLAWRQFLATDAPQPQQQQRGILQAYQALLAEGRLQQDGSQLAAVQALQLLQDALATHLQLRLVQQQHQHPQASPSDAAASHSDAAETTTSIRPQGAYLWGPVGSGKTSLMDLFLNSLPTVTPLPQAGGPTPNTQQQQGVAIAAQRMHFHTFMLGVHQQLHRLQQALPVVVGRSRSGLPVHRHALPPEDPVLVVARTAAANTHLLCLDELHVTDVADAMLLSRLLTELLRCGCWVVCTSNRPARDLYKGGLSRKHFLPFVQLVDDSLLQLRIAGGQDYRVSAAASSNNNKQQQQDTASAAGSWFVGPDSNKQLQQQWQAMLKQVAATTDQAAAASSDSSSIAPTAAAPTHIPLPFGRSLFVPQAVHYPHSSRHQQQQQPEPQQQQQQQQQLAGAYFTFDQLCGSAGSRESLARAGALSANDFAALVQSCDRLFVEGVPQLQPSQRDEARRLVTLIDLLYEEHTHYCSVTLQLCVSAQVAPHELFLPLLGAAALQGINPNLGRAGNKKLDVKALLQEARAAGQPSQAHSAGSAVAGEDATVGRQPSLPPKQQQQQSAGSAPPQSQPPPPPAALLAEEVLMYHRAASRLAELCAAVS